MRGVRFLATVVLSAVPVTLITADVWDPADNDQGTFNEIVHGLIQRHDMPLQNIGTTEDVDYYRLGFRPVATSWEVRLEGFSSDIGNVSRPFFNRVNTVDTVLQTSTNVGASKTLRWQVTASSSTAEYIKVSDAACFSSCTTLDGYTIRAYDTTIAVPRFNNSATQFTILIVQNTMTSAADGTVWFWNVAGALLASRAFSVPQKGTFVLNTSTVVGVAGQSGSMTISHTAGYGNLAAKAVALEPSTGFSFDTPGVYKAH